MAKEKRAPETPGEIPSTPSRPDLEPVTEPDHPLMPDSDPEPGPEIDPDEPGKKEIPPVTGKK